MYTYFLTLPRCVQKMMHTSSLLSFTFLLSCPFLHTNTMSALTLEIARNVAKAQGLKEAYFNEKSRVVSLARPGEEVERIRFNVYYTTGTVGTCLNHPRQGYTQLFRRNVFLEKLREIFRNPRIHAGPGYHRKNAASDAHQQRGGATKRKKLDNGSSQAVQSKFLVGSRANVKGFANCTVLSGILGDSHQRDTHGGKIKVKYDDGTIYHIDPDQFEEVMEESLDEETAAKEQMKVLELENERLEEEKKNLVRSPLSRPPWIHSKKNGVKRQKPNAANGWLKLPERKQRRKKRGRNKLE